MKTEFAIALSDYVRKNREQVVNMSGTMAQKAALVSADVGFAVKQGQLRDVLRANGIETRRRSQNEVRMDALTAENERLEQRLRRYQEAVALVLAGSILPTELREYIIGDLPKKLRDLLNADEPC